MLIRGESGTGKGVLARRSTRWSRRSAGPFVTVSCPSLSAELLESELFGHVRGAFTGAVRDDLGKVAAAEGGTLFLDEVGDLPLPLQPKLLRFLQDRGTSGWANRRLEPPIVRLIAATNRDLEAEAASGRFREDLLYRLNVVDLTLPPLRSRTDLLDLADTLAGVLRPPDGTQDRGLLTEARAALSNYPWPGNLRELRNAMERAVLFVSSSQIELDDLPGRISTAAPAPRPHGSGPVEVGGPVTLEELETEHIRRVLIATETREEAARILGIDPSTLYRKRKQLGL